MIKQITTAALIAAGTALASADTTWTTLISNASISEGNTSLGTLGLTQDYDYASYSWCVKFTVDISNANNGLGVFTTVTSGAGLQVRINTTSGYLNIVNNDGAGHLSTPDSTSGGTQAFTPVSSDGDSLLDVTLSWDATAETMTLKSSQSGGSDFEATLDLTEGATHRNLIEYATLSTDSTFWTNSAESSGIYTMAITNISVAVAPAPEPSMFGLVAGLGALGIVAARRRRSRKA